MQITLNHTIVPAKDKESSAQWFADIMGLKYEGLHGHFAPVRINDSLTLDYDNREGDVPSHHYAFHVSEEDFDAIFGRLRAKGVVYGSGPRDKVNDGDINHRKGGRGVYFTDPDGHVMELMTVA